MMNRSLEMEQLNNSKKQIYSEQENFYISSIKKQCMDIKLWKIKVEMVSNMKNKEIQKRNLQINELKNLQDKLHKKRVESCDSIQNLIKGSWMANLGSNFGSVTQNTAIAKYKTNTSFIYNKLDEELNEIKYILEGLNFTRQQDKKIMEYIIKIQSVERSITIWNDEILKIELKISESKNE